MASALCTGMVLLGTGVAQAAPAAFPAQAPTGPTVSCTSDPNVFNTGYNAANGGFLPKYAADAHWEVSNKFPTSATASPPPANVSYSPATVANWGTPYRNAQWITDNPDQSSFDPQNANRGDWYYRYQFTLDPAVSPEQFSLPINFMADNSVAEAYVNGKPQSGYDGSGLPQSPLGSADPKSPAYVYDGYSSASRAARATLSHDWQAGANTLVILLKSGGGPQGINAQIRPGTVCAVADSSTALTSTPNPSTFGQSVALTATVTGPTGVPTGTVSFRDGDTPLGDAPVGPDGRATLNTDQLRTGSHTLTAVYNGSPAYTGSTSAPVTQQVNPGPAKSIVPTSGNNQQTPAGTPFPDPLVASVFDGSGAPTPGRTVTFTITGPATFAGGSQTATAGTDAEGRATSPQLIAGNTTGAVRVEAATEGISTTFVETVNAPVPASIAPMSGSGQTAAVGTPFPKPLVATVTDTIGKPSVGTVVTFQVTGGSASFPSGTTATATTDGNGRATSPTLTAGPDAGPVTIKATAPGVADAATFTENVTTVTVRGTAVFPSGGVNYSLSVDARATGPTQGAGGMSVAGGDSNTTARARTITSVTKNGDTAVVTGTALTSAGQVVPFRLTVTDRAGGRDQITLQLGNRTLSGTVSTGNITIA